MVYLPIDEALVSEKEIEFRGQKMTVSEVAREHFMKVIPENDHKFAALTCGGIFGRIIYICTEWS